MFARWCARHWGCSDAKITGKFQAEGNGIFRPCLLQGLLPALLELCALAGLSHGVELSGMSEPGAFVPEQGLELCLGQNKHVRELWPLVYWAAQGPLISEEQRTLFRRPLLP